MQPLLTVGIPVYNGMPYLPESLASILGQTYSNFEVIVVNDGSTDDSLKYLRSVRDSRLRVISQPNRGITSALNRILAEAHTPWLVRLDADDIACPDRLALLVEAIRQRPDAGMFYTDATHYGHARAISKLRTTMGTPDELRAITKSGYLLSICHVSTALNIAKTQNLGGYRFNLFVEDLDLWWRMALKHDIVFIPRVTVSVRLRNASTCVSNLKTLSLNALYVQYLLLSHLWKFSPLGYDAVTPFLAQTVDSHRMSYRYEMWLAGSEISSGHHARALPHLARAICKSPRHFFDRLFHLFSRPEIFSRGEDPAQFRHRQQLLWPSAIHSLGETI
jgi:glycosyltransferase involved in cell wall biosynthesis